MIEKLFYIIRNFRCRKMFKEIKKYCRGDVLDVGGGEFYKTILKKKIIFNSYTVLEPNIEDGYCNRIHFVKGDGCNMQFDKKFDTILNIQVLEHVYEPNKMMSEMARLLKPGGYLIALISQTAATHNLPGHYYNFLKSWIEKVFKQNNLTIIKLKPLGGAWSTLASRMFFIIPQSLGVKDMAYAKRNIIFYLLWPFTMLFICLVLPAMMIFSLSDLEEEPNNNLVVAKKYK